MKKKWDSLWLNANMATFSRDGYGLIDNAAMAVKEGKIAWIGKLNALAQAPEMLADEVHNVNHRCVTPGLIDCHTHLIYAGNRYHEFEMRLEGASYEDIAKAGGGIRSTVKATRKAPESDLLKQSLPRAKAMLDQGVTTVEIKSGYGLDLDNEIKMLKVAKRIGNELPITVQPTFLGAHALPEEFANKPDDYIDLVCNVMLPIIADEKLAVAVDAFCENIGFTAKQTERVFRKAGELNLRVKLHAEQLSDQKGAVLAAKYSALSADHLEYINEDGVKALSQAGTVAVLLPGAFYFLREKKSPPIDLLRKHKVPIALATDSNPGSSPTTALPLMLSMACTFWDLTPLEAWQGVTLNAARALNLQSQIGSLEVGKHADFVVWDIQHPAELAYAFGGNLVSEVVTAGRVV